MKPNLLVISNYSDPVAPVRPEAEIFLRLAKQGYAITVLTPDSGVYPAKLKKAGCRVIDFSFRGKFDATAVRQIRHAVLSSDIQIVHAFHSKGIANAAWALWGNKNVKLLSYRGYTGNIHWYDPTNYISFLNPRIDAMVCLAESVREQYLRNGVKPDRAITIHKGHDPRWYADIQASDLSEFNFSSNTLVCTLVANHRVHMKGIRYVVDAARILKGKVNIAFLLIGEGLDTKEVRSWIKKDNVEEAFHFTDFRADAAGLVKAGDISLSASLYGEATQKAVIEAMNLGKAMIISDISGNKGMVENGVSGFVVPPADGEAIAQSIRAYAENPQLRIDFGYAAKAHIQSFLSIDKTVAQYAALYEELASK